MNLRKREVMFYVAVGRKRIGKTHQTILVIERYWRIGNPSVGLKPRKVLIFDVNNEYSQYNPIYADAESIKRFSAHPKIECRRVSPKKPNGKIKSRKDFQQDLINILENFKSGLLVLEDLSLLVGDAVSQDLVGRLCTHAHNDIDIITHFQMISKSAHPKFKPLTTIVRLHKTTDSSNRPSVKKNLGDDYSKVRIGELIINNRYNIGISKMTELEVKGRGRGDKEYDYWDFNYQRFYLHIDYNDHKIIGGFSREEFDLACKRYLQEEVRDEINPMLTYKDANGKYEYTYKTAFEYKMKELARFYGNKK